jgi:hypothetical protein
VLLGGALLLGLAFAVVSLTHAWSLRGAPDQVLGWRTAGLWAVLNVAVGVLLIWQRPGLRYPWLMFAAGLLMSLLVVVQLRTDQPADLYFELATFPALLAQLFPTGHRLSGRLGWLTYVGAVGYVGITTLTATGAADDNPGFVVHVFAYLWAAGLLATVPIVLVRFRRSDGEQRAQLKWFLLGVTLSCAGWLSASPIGEARTWVVPLCMALPPIAIVISLLRYRLYDIDRVISRTASYGLTTAVVVAVYVGAVTAASRLLPTSDTLAVALATLAAAAAFRPLLRRIRSAVDRRFDRTHYDAIRTADAFGQRLSNVVDPAAVVHDLEHVVTASLQPSSVTVSVVVPR